jgi:outer membrane lipoprotein-sorting protein
VSPVRAVLVLITLAAAVSCAPRLATLPSGPGSPFPDYASAYAQASEACRDVRTMAAVLAISGRAGRSRFRANVDAGFEAPGRVRLELPAPGKPLFTFVANGGESTLVLPREGRVLRNAPPAATLDALAGVPLEPDQLREIVAGCGFASGQPTKGQAFEGGWASIAIGDATNWLRQTNGAWRIAAATRGPVDVRYDNFVGGRPSTIRLRTSPTEENAASDLTIRLSQVDVNQPLGPDVFRVEIPAGAKPLTLDELREAGPRGR